MAPEPAHDPRGVTMAVTIPQRSCPICRAGFTPAGRRRYCSAACRARAYRRRRAARAPELPPPPTGGVRAASVYECPGCGQRYLGEQRCPDCGVFCRRVGLGGACPHCGDPVAVADLIEPPGETASAAPTAAPCASGFGGLRGPAAGRRITR